MRFLSSLALPVALLAVSMPVHAAEADASPATVRVRLVTSAGDIVLALDARRAPATTANFMAYVDDGRLDGTRFYRAARSKAAPERGFIQGGIGTDARRVLMPPVKLEPTSRTGIRHLDATVSMARHAYPDSATGNFVLTVGPTPNMDASGSYLGYAAFGRVVAGMDVVRHILALPTGGGSGAMRGQMILKPVKLIRAVRLNGKAKPTGRVKPWLIDVRRKPAAQR